MGTEIVLTPAQEGAYEGLLSGIEKGTVCALRGDAGMGKTSILRKVHGKLGGMLLDLRQFIDSLMGRTPAELEEAFLMMIETGTASHDLVIVDDLHLITNITGHYFYQRKHLLDVSLTAILSDAAVAGKKLVFAGDDEALWPIRRRAYSSEIGGFTAEDYAHICGAYLAAEVLAGLEFAKIHRFAPKLNGHQLKNCCVWLRSERAVDTERFIAYLSSQNLTSNVALEEVQAVDWRDLKGVDDVIEALEAKVALPFENDELAAELKLKPKRGVLLAGPPGTGKTTIGRALAHRLKSKFFLIDGTVVAGSGDFYCKIQEIFEAAKQNAPSIIFIDDTDVIFEGDEERGFYRYLLTMLDGLESASAERVCVIMTAMNAGSLPAAVLRSGRVELWLEMRLPGVEARESILGERLSMLPLPLARADVPVLASASRGLTGADLKAVVEDAKLLFAHDRARGKPLRQPEDYFLEAIETVQANRRNYARSKPVKFAEPVRVGFGVE